MTMKNKQTAGQGKQAKIQKKKAEKSAKTSPKKALLNRAPIRLRPSAQKYVSKRAQDKYSKPSLASETHQGSSGASGKIKSNSSKTTAQDRSKSFTKIKPAEKCNHTNKKSTLKKAGVIKAKTNKDGKGKVKRKAIKQLNANDFFDVWAFVSIGKREASLNASMKVNIMFERYTAPKPVKTPPQNKAETQGQSSKHDDFLKDKVSSKNKATIESCSVKSNRKTLNDSQKKSNFNKDKERTTVKEKAQQGNKKLQEEIGGKKAALQSKSSDARCAKRKNISCKVTENEPVEKKCNLGKKLPVKLKSKSVKKVKKNIPSGHQLSNIIEKSPRQASLVAKAMIAMEQEEEAVVECSASRTLVYDWTELRSYIRTKSRRIKWFNGLGNYVKEKHGKDSHEGQQGTSDSDACASDADVGNGGDPNKALEGESLHNTFLRTLHQTGDSRLLNEYLRAQKEDFQGFVDIEMCSSPEQKKQPSPDPKKSLPVSTEHKEPEKVLEKPTTCSPTKPQPCRVATPIPQFPSGHRASNITSFIHSPMSQPLYSQQRGYAQPQPIKVTPYPPSPAYIYQYTGNRSQTEVYAPSSPSPIHYGMSSGDAGHRDYTTLTFNQIGRLNLDGRGMNPYQPAAFNTNLHLPVQQIGFNYGAYYPTPIQPLPRQTMAPLQTLHQQYPMVQAPVITQQQVNPDVGQGLQHGPYQHGYSHYAPLPAMRQSEKCMPPPPPPPPPAHRPTPVKPSGPVRHLPLSSNTMASVSSVESLRSLNSAVIQPVVKSPALDFTPNFMHQQDNTYKHLPAVPSCQPHHQLYKSHPCKGTNTHPTKYYVTCNGLNRSFTSCKREQGEVPMTNCDLLNKSSERLPKSSASSRSSSESSDVSDLLHSAHSTMYQIDGMSSLENMQDVQQSQASATCESSMRNVSPCRINVGYASFNTSYSMSSILDMPTCRVKSEPENKSGDVPEPSYLLNSIDQKVLEPFTNQLTFVCFASAGSSDGSHAKETNNTPSNNTPQKNDTPSQNRNIHKTGQNENSSGKSNTKDVVIIDDTDDSSDDEPLARLVKFRSSDASETYISETPSKDDPSKADDVRKLKQSTPSNTSQLLKVKTRQKIKPSEPGTNQSKLSPDSCKSKKSKAPSSTDNKHSDVQSDDESLESLAKPLISATDSEGKSQSDKEVKKLFSKKASFGSSPKIKKPVKKPKSQPALPLSQQKVNANHGWVWVGEGEMKPIPKITPGREEPVRIRKCYQSMKHTSGETVSIRDCVILQSDGDGKIPYVAKVSALWENLNGEMMFSMLWYYQPEHTAAGREPEDGEQELFASKHREENSVACIDDKCYVLTYNEYCRLEAEVIRQEQGVTQPKWKELMPEVAEDDKKLRRLPPPANTCVDNIWFCRYDYDARKKMVKKPKHKKSNLRYRAPSKIL